METADPAVVALCMVVRGAQSLPPLASAQNAAQTLARVPTSHMTYEVQHDSYHSRFGLCPPWLRPKAPASVWLCLRGCLAAGAARPSLLALPSLPALPGAAQCGRTAALWIMARAARAEYASHHLPHTCRTPGAHHRLLTKQRKPPAQMT